MTGTITVTVEVEMTANEDPGVVGNELCDVLLAQKRVQTARWDYDEDQEDKAEEAQEEEDLEDE